MRNKSALCSFLNEEFPVKLEIPQFPEEEFNLKFISKAILSKCAFVLHGPPATGKTTFAVSHFRDPLKVNTPDDLKLYNEEQHDAIVFDDWKWTKKSKLTQSRVLTLERFDLDLTWKFFV